MKFKQTKELIYHAVFFHTMIGDHFLDESERTQNQRLKLLLGYLAEHQRDQAKRLSEYGDHAPNKILDTWFQFIDCEERFNQIIHTLEKDETTVEEVIDKTIMLYDCLITHFESFSNLCDTEEIRDVFECIVKLEKKDKLKIVRNVRMLDDL